MKKNKKSDCPIYIADANNSFLQGFKEFINGSGINLYSFTDGRTLFETTAVKRPSLIILNTNLPVMGGLETIDAIRTLPCSLVPFVVIMGDNSVELQSEVVKRQVLCSLLCPPDFTDLKNIILKAGLKI